MKLFVPKYTLIIPSHIRTNLVAEKPKIKDSKAINMRENQNTINWFAVVEQKETTGFEMTDLSTAGDPPPMVTE